MKRLAALLTALMLLTGTLPALAASKSLVEKFQGQLLEQGFKGTVTFSAGGKSTAAVSADDWQWLLSAASRVTLETLHSFANRSDGQVDVNVLIDGKAEGKSTLLYNSAMVGFTSDFLAGHGSVWYTADRTWNPYQILQTALGSDSAWPPVWGLILDVRGADSAWKERAGQLFVIYETKIGSWMNGYAALSSNTQKDANYTQLQYKIPVKDVKAEIQSLLDDFYADASLLSLLREIASSAEAASYLQPGMKKSFQKMLDQVKLKGSVEITRRFNKNGALILDQIRLPFASGQTLKEITIAVTPGKTGDTWAFSGTAGDGTEFDVTCLITEEKTYSGAVTLAKPAQNGVTDQIAFDYNLTWDEGKEEYDLATDRFNQTMKGTLVIKPHETDRPSQSIILEAGLSSPSAERSATKIEAVLTWRDLDSDASVAATLSGRTAAPGEVTKIGDLKKPTRVDRLAGGAYAALVKQWKEKASAWLREAAEQLLPASLPASGTVGE